MKRGMQAIVHRGLTRSVAVLIFATLAGSQTPVRRPPFEAFEVATIKPTGPEPTGSRWIRMQSGDRFVAHNHAVRTLIATAFNLSPQAISGGPGWVDSERWDILAKTSGGVRPDLAEQMSMLRQLLSERFKLVYHREPKQLSITC